MKLFETGLIEKKDSLAIKGVAILAMLCHHMYRVPKQYVGYAVVFSPFSEMGTNLTFNFMKFCVGMFAFVSGYGLTESYKKFRNTHQKDTIFFFHHYTKMMTTYWLVFVISLVVCQLINGRTASVYFTGNWLENLGNLIISFFGLHTLFKTPYLISEWWYISAALVFILMIPFLFRIGEEHGDFFSIAMLIALPRIMNLGFLGGMEPMSFMMALLLGAVSSRHNFACKIKANIIVSWILAVVLIVLAYNIYTLLAFDQYYEIKYGLVPIMLIIALNSSVLNIRWIKEFLCFWGRYSTGIWLTHTLIRMYLSSFLYGLGEIHFLLGLFAIGGLSLCAAVLIDTMRSYMNSFFRCFVKEP